MTTLVWHLGYANCSYCGKMTEKTHRKAIHFECRKIKGAKREAAKKAVQNSACVKSNSSVS